MAPCKVPNSHQRTEGKENTEQAQTGITNPHRINVLSPHRINVFSTTG